MMRAGSYAARTIPVLPRPARAFLSLLGLTAVIAGILAMHVWMGAHGSMTDDGASSASMTTMAGHSDAPAAVASASTPDALEPALELARVHAADMAADMGAAGMSALSGSMEDGMLAGCGEDCSDEMAIGTCVLALIAAGIAGLLTPIGRALVSSLIRRGPPALQWESRPLSAPSLTHLCISRT